MTLRKNTDPFRMMLPRRIIDLVGIELEGGWETMPELCVLARERRPCEDPQCERCMPHRAGDPNRGGNNWTRYKSGHVPDAAYHADGSVSFNRPGLSLTGEIVSAPLKVRQVKAWGKRWWPEAINKSCGLHVHMSFLVPVAHVAGLIADHGEWFDQTFRERMAVVGHRLGLGGNFRDRLEGQNTYCLPGIACNSSDRYRQVNLASAWKHKTVECRLLPAIKDAETGVKAILAVVGTIDRMVRFLIARERFNPLIHTETMEQEITLAEAVNVQATQERTDRAASARSLVMAQAS